MRWDALFEDLDSQWRAAEQRALENEVNELARVESAQSTLADALRGSVGRELTAVLRNDAVVHGVLQRVAAQWLLLGAGRRSVLLPLSSLVRITGVNGSVVPESRGIPHTLGAALRALARNRAVVTVDVDQGRPTSLRGVLDRVGADYVQVALMIDGATRRHANLGGFAMVPMGAIVSVSSAAENGADPG